MTAADFASLVDGRPVGPSRWMAHCPGHRDKSPSLSIGEGRDGRVIVNCFASCQLTAVLTAMKLRLRDLFPGEPPSAAQRKAIEAQRMREQQQGRELGEAAADARRFELYVDRLGAELALLSDDDPRAESMTGQFHRACEEFHRVETTYERMRLRRTARAVNASRC